MEETNIIETNKDSQIEIKQQALSQINLLKKRHEEVKSEMIKVLEASQILDIQYNELEKEMYELETEYVEVMKILAE